MFRNRESVIERMCQLNALVAHSINDWSEPSDCFCNGERPWSTKRDNTFRHSGGTIKFIKEAILEKLQKDGFTPSVLILDELSKQED